MSNSTYIKANPQGFFDVYDSEKHDIKYHNVADAIEIVREYRWIGKEKHSVIELKYLNEGMRNFTVSTAILSSQQDALSMFLKVGYLIDYRYVNHVRSYLVQRLRLRRHNIIYYHDQLGFFKQSDGQQRFLLDVENINNTSSYYHDRETFDFSKGDHYANLAFLREEIIGHPNTELALALGLSSVLASHLKAEIDDQTLIVNLCGPSSSGKTTTAQFIGSLWANPRIRNQGIVKTFSNTEKARFSSIEGYNGVPIIFDDLTTAPNIKRSELVYQLAQGSPRSRMTNYGQTIEEGKPWSGLAIVTSETEILSQSETRGGLMARVIDIDQLKWTNDSDHAKRIKAGIQTNYGHIGRFFVEHFMQKSDDDIKAMYQNLHNEMDQAIESKDNLSGRVIPKLAMIQTTGKLINAFFDFNIDLDQLKATLIELEEAQADTRSTDLRALDIVKHYIQTYHKEFEQYSDGAKLISASNKQSGIMIFNGEQIIVRIPAQTVKEILARERFYEYKNILKAWSDQGIIKTQSGRNTINVAGLTPRAIEFHFQRTEDTMLPWYSIAISHQNKQNKTGNNPIVYDHDYNDDAEIDALFSDKDDEYEA